MNKQGTNETSNNAGYGAKLEGFFNKKLKYDKINRKIKTSEKVSKKQKKNQLFYEFDKKQFRLVDENKIASITAPRIGKENTEENMAENIKSADKKKKIILNTKYELLFEYKDIENYAEIYDTIIAPSEAENDIYQKEIDEFEKKKDNKATEYKKMREEIILDLDTYKTDLKNQIDGDININKAESMKEYIQKQYELYELNSQHYLDGMVIDETAIKSRETKSSTLKIDVLG